MKYRNTLTAASIYLLAVLLGSIIGVALAALVVDPSLSLAGQAVLWSCIATSVVAVVLLGEIIDQG
jgi:hypothetical protein